MTSVARVICHKWWSALVVKGMSTYEESDQRSPETETTLDAAMDDVTLELSRVEQVQGEAAVLPAELDQNLPEQGYYQAGLMSLRSALRHELDNHKHP